MEILIQVAQLLLSISILVLLHEMGHVLFARLFNTRVEKFYLFFNPWFSLFKFRRGHTEYGLGWLPLGGYVKISGMMDESLDKEQLKKPPEPYEYRVKPAWQRLLITSGGVIVNFLLAFVIYSLVLFAWGERYLPTRNLTYGVACSPLALELGFQHGDRIVSVNGEEVKDFSDLPMEIVLARSSVVTVDRGGQRLDVPIGEEHLPALIRAPVLFEARVPLLVNAVEPQSAAYAAGFQVGDRLVAINGQPARFFDEFRAAVSTSAGDTIALTLSRGGVPVEIAVEVPEGGILGIRNEPSLAEFFELNTIEYSLLEAIPAGIRRGVSTIESYLQQMALVFTPSTQAYESLGGFITIGSIFPQTWNWQSFWTLTAFLSVILAIMNLLPIPALDGGHILFILYEMITGHKPSDKFLEYAHVVGITIVLALVIFANANDIVRLLN